ncbi:tyrosine-type recombinase/integrase [Paraburkholderia panacisoli]|uniref:Tyrosine-type recombinase/integrase n=1 Tax=Paraburkholderia panacisoli TaxID=2603818 RepID=A0A5B0GL81_9BURK|nr:site-specific integrase [Paraburkholderia panacisoli]KAA1003585.1 tyrosine-type recombinase/integrase [Paraburkholderia panacisoli]
MARKHHALDELQLRRWIAAGEPVAKADGDGLTFTLSDTRAATWILRYSRGRRRREITLGSYPELTLSEARKKTRFYRARIDAGEDPATDRKVEKARVRAAMTVSKLCDDFEKKRYSDLSVATVDLYRWLIATLLKPAIGSLDVPVVRASDVVYMVENCGRPWSVCQQLLGITRQIFAHAIGKRLIDANPVIGIDLTAVKGKQPAKRVRVMLMKNELSDVLTGLDDKLGRQDALMFRILLATCVRQSELIRTKKAWIDLVRGSWYVEAEAIKTRDAFLVPLAPLVVEWMRELIGMAGDSEWLCPARSTRSKTGHVGRSVLQTALRDAFNRNDFDVRRFTPHDTRSTAKGHLRNLGFSRDISEIALNHKLPGIEGIYDVREEIPERRAAMEAWARFIEDCCESKEPDAGHSVSGSRRLQLPTPISLPIRR